MENETIDIGENLDTLDKLFIKKFDIDKITKQWFLLIKAIKRDILDILETRQSIINYTSIPLYESLPKDFINDISVSDKVTKLLKRFDSELLEFLRSISVSENQISPNSEISLKLDTPEIEINKLIKIYGFNTKRYFENLEKLIESFDGVNKEEKQIIALKYCFARDIKLLTLGTEIFENCANINIGEDCEIVLSSGIIININNTIDKKEVRNLLNTNLWNKRKQIKDRVYEIKVGDNTYIMKERKTTKHIDTFISGHEEGLSSLEEFKTAQYFRQNLVIEEDNIKVNYENPILSVKFPDGFEFTIFEKEENLIKEFYITSILASEIIKLKNQYEEEYEEIRKIAKNFKNDPRITLFKYDINCNYLNCLENITFEEFAILKAFRIKRKANKLIQKLIAKSGYFDNDPQESLYKIHIKNGKIQLEIVKLDFEYFIKVDENNFDMDFGEDEEMGINFNKWSDNSEVKMIQRLAYLAILEIEKLNK